VQKINAANSWNFALIDYFHDMSLLKEGDGVNFQKASCTLDGCVKIYTSRVDSVATETGKLLSGLADSGNKKRKGEEEGDAQAEGEDEEDGEGEDGIKKKTKKKSQRSSENTLVSSFAQLQLKKMELEFSVDPLFKKASADFDEGGAKGLLLNHLTIDAHGRIAFDSSDDVREQEEQVEKDEDEEDAKPEVDIDVEVLGLRFFPDLERIDEQDICPSLKAFELGGGEDTLDIPFLKVPEDWRKDEAAPQDENQNAADYGDEPLGGFDDDDDNDVVRGGFDVIEMGEVGFGEGGEAWAREAAMNTQPRVALASDGMDNNEGEQGLGDEVGGFEANSAQYGIALVKDKDFSRDNILSYFDQALQKNWAGPEHWRIRKIKDSTKSTTTVKRKEKEPFEIDFMSPLTQAMADMIYTPATTNATISLPKSQWKSKTRNLLPDDKHFNSRQLLRLFLKPKARIGAKRQVAQTQSCQPGNRSADTDDLPDGAEMDGAYWARQHAANTAAAASTAALDDDAAQAANYDANFFQDDGLALPGMGDDDDNDHFADAAEHFPVDAEHAGRPGDSQSMLPTTQESGFGTQLVTQSRRLRPEYVQYARVATRVDVRRLKEEMWRDIGVHSTAADSTVTSPDPSSPTTPKEAEGIEKALGEGELRFTDVINNLQSVYNPQTMADISTSYCFIALLHLANEKGLVLRHEEGFGDIRIARDAGAVVVEGEE